MKRWFAILMLACCLVSVLSSRASEDAATESLEGSVAGYGKPYEYGGQKWVSPEGYYHPSGCQKGDKGDKGDTGATGLKGDTGSKGDKGDKGDTGATGLKGDTGAKGDKGDKGDTGATGLKGDTGAKGDKGDKGDTGATGGKGDKGDKGDPGRDGNRKTQVCINPGTAPVFPPPGSPESATPIFNGRYRVDTGNWDVAIAPRGNPIDST